MCKIYATSDLHGFLPDPKEVPTCDILLIAGDLTPVYNHHPAYQVEWLGSTFKAWLEMIRERVGAVVACAGNHDFCFQTIPHKIPELPWIYLQDRGVEIKGVKIYGTPWTPTFGRWAFMAEEESLESIFAEIPQDLDILLSHGPPHGYGDRNLMGDHCGSYALTQRIAIAKPQHVVVGHIHESYGLYPGTEQLSGTSTWNVSRVNFTYQPINPLIEIQPCLLLT